MKTFAFDIQRFNVVDDTKTALNAFNRLYDIITQLELKERAEEWLLKGPAVLAEWADDNVNPILKFVATFLKDEIKNKTGSSKGNAIVESLNSAAAVISIIVKGYEINEELKKETPSAAAITSKTGSIISSMTLVAKSIDKLANSERNSFFLAVMSAGISLVANIIAGADGIDESEKEKISESCSRLLKELGKESFEAIFSEKFTAGGGPLDFIFSFITGLTNAVILYHDNLEKYTDDGIPQDIAKKDAGIDAIGNFVHDAANTYFKGLDDAIFNFEKWVAKVIWGAEVYDPDKDYTDYFCDLFKTLTPRQHVIGRKIGDTLAAYIDNDFCYTDDGNDYIGIMAANATVWAGHGDDTITSRPEQFEGYSLPVKNSIFGGPGNDVFHLYDNLSTVYGGTGKDSIVIYGKYNKLFGDNGDDIIGILEDATGTTAEGGHGNDIIGIQNTENVVIRYKDGDGNDNIFGFDEDDKLEISGEYYLFTSGEDIIVKVGEGSMVLRQAAGKNLNINNNTDHEFNTGTAPEISSPVSNSPNFEDFSKGVKQFSIITGTDGDDEISNDKEIAIINALDGDDTVNNVGRSVTVNGGGGNDSLYTASHSVTIHGDEGDDYIENRDHFYMRFENLIMDGGNGNDHIINHFSANNTILGGDGNDLIENNGANVSIDGGNGNDHINNYRSDSHYASTNITINGGDGDDYIRNYNSNWVIINGGDGNDYIDSYFGLNAKINGGNGDDYIKTWGHNSTIDGGNGNDYIDNYHTHVSINGGNGNDSICNHHPAFFNGDSNYSTINGGDGDDYIYNCKDEAFIVMHGGDGNDNVINLSDNVSIDAGNGNDTIILDESAQNNLIAYNLGDGFDTVAGFNGDDTLSISGGEYSTQISGNDVFVNVGSGSIKLVDAKDIKLNIIGTYKTDTTPADTTPADTTPADTTPPDTTPADTTPADTTPADTTPADTTPADTTPASTTLTVTNSTSSPVTIDSAIEVVDASTRTKAVKITGNALDNTLTGGSGNDTLDGNSGDDLLTGGSGNDVFIFGEGNDTVTDYGNGNDKVSLTAAAKSFGYVGNDFVFDFADGSLTLTDAASKKISVVGSVTKIFTTEGIYNAAGTAVTLSALTETFTADSKIVTINAASTSNATITGNSKANKVSLGNGNVFVWTGGNDTLSNFAANDLLSVTGAVTDASTSGGNSYVKVGTNKITVKDSSQVTFSDANGTRIFDGGVFFDADETSATLATSTKNFNASSTNVTSIIGNAKANKLTSNATGTTLTGGKGNDTFVTAGGDDFITDYGTGNDKISLGSSIENFTVKGDDVSLDLSEGSLTIAGGAGKKISLVSGGKTTANIFTDDGLFNAAGTAVTLNASTTEFTADSKVVMIDAGLTSNATITGNSKANKVSLGTDNVFVWTGGNDTLTNFGANDLISVTGAVTDGTVTKGTSVLTVGKNKITVKDSSTVTFADDGGTKIFSNGIFTDTDETSATLGSAIKDFDAASTTFTAVTGNAKANKLHAGDTSTMLDGGKGNDSLWGGDNSDTFIYSKGDGKDVIFGFGSNDLLEIVGLNGAVTGKFNSAGTELTVKVGNTAVAVLKDFGATTTFNINGDTYHVSGQTIVK